MKDIERPLKVHLDGDGKLSILEFSDREVGRYYMRGGICWPRFEGRDVGMVGCAVMCGQDVDSGIIRVFEQCEFAVIDHIVTPEGLIEIEGLAPWFNMCWSRYMARKFYYSSSHTETHRKYLLEVLRSKMIEPKPEFIEVFFGDSDDMTHTLCSRIQERKFQHRAEDQLAEEFPVWHAELGAPPAVIDAVCVCVEGFSRYQYRPRAGKGQRKIKWM